MDIARNRQRYAERRGFKPCGLGNIYTHLYGAASEIAAGRLLGVPLPGDWDWTWEGDRRRGGDLVLPDGTKVHVRSSRKGDNFLWRPGRDSTDGIWLFCDTSRYPLIVIAGWLTGDQAAMVGDTGRIPGMWLRDLSALHATGADWAASL